MKELNVIVNNLTIEIKESQPILEEKKSDYPTTKAQTELLSWAETQGRRREKQFFLINQG